MMTHEELERVYDKPDPWGYQTNPADIERKYLIIQRLEQIAKCKDHGFKDGLFEKALDIACGEGWITQDIPAKEIYGFEASEQARSRWPSNIKHLHWIFGDDKYDLVLMTGCLYQNYSWLDMVGLASLVASKYVVTCNIAEREHFDAIRHLTLNFKEIHMEEFSYDRGDEKFTQRLRIFRR